MTTIKSYTDLEQSKKLAEFLPIESADMHYNNASIKGINYVDEYRAELMDYNNAIKLLSKYKINPLFEVVTCWSIASLLAVLPEPELTQGSDRRWMLRIWDKKRLPWTIGGHVNPVDVCYEMIIKLNEQNIL